MFQDLGFRALAHKEAEARAFDASKQFAQLISRYPNLSEIELARLIDLYGGLSALDMALMISDEELGARLDRFFNDHSQDIRTPFRQYAVLMATAVAGIAVIAWALVFGQ